jgi:hypothetical protein
LAGAVWVWKGGGVEAALWRIERVRCDVFGGWIRVRNNRGKRG